MPEFCSSQDGGITASVNMGVFFRRRVHKIPKECRARPAVGHVWSRRGSSFLCSIIMLFVKIYPPLVAHYSPVVLTRLAENALGDLFL